MASAKAGADLAICDIVIDDGELATTAKSVSQLGQGCIASAADMRNKGQADGFVDSITGTFGELHVFASNAGTGDTTPLVKLEEQQWDNVIATNLKDYFSGCTAAARRMVEQEGDVTITISSMGTLRPR